MNMDTAGYHFRNALQSRPVQASLHNTADGLTDSPARRTAHDITRRQNMSSHSPVAYLAGDESSTYAKVTWRLLPFLFVCYLCAYLDRINVSFAKLQMLSDLHFSEAVYGAGAGVFFIG